jgi:hypothetical protein
MLVAQPPTPSGRSGVLAAMGVLAVVCFAPVLLRLTSGVSPWFLYALATFVNLGLGGFAWLGVPDFAAPGLDQHAIAVALFTVSAGLLAFGVGYAITRPPRDVRPSRPGALVPVWVLFALFGVGLAATAILFVTGRYGFLAIFSGPSGISWWQQWVQTMSGLTTLATLAVAVHAFANDSRVHRRTLIVMLCISSGIGFLGGYKSTVLLPLVMTLFVYFFYRRRFPWKPALAMTLALFVLVPANLAYRKAIAGGNGLQSASLGSVIDAARGAGTVDTSFADKITSTLQWGSVRSRIVDSIAQIERRTPSQIPYAGAGSYAQIPAITLLPRLFWPDKPTGATGIDFGIAYFDASTDSVSSYAVTNMGDLFIHSGLLGVALGMATWGAIGGVLFRWLRRRESPSALLVYVVALFQMAQVELDIAGLVSGAFRAILLAWIVGRTLYGPMPLHLSRRSGLPQVRVTPDV